MLLIVLQSPSTPRMTTTLRSDKKRIAAKTLGHVGSNLEETGQHEATRPDQYKGFYITKAMVETFGATQGCKGCQAIMAGKRGWSHRAGCRARFMEEAGKKEDQHLAERLTRMKAKDEARFEEEMRKEAKKNTLPSYAVEVTLGIEGAKHDKANVERASADQGGAASGSSSSSHGVKAAQAFGGERAGSDEEKTREEDKRRSGEQRSEREETTTDEPRTKERKTEEREHDYDTRRRKASEKREEDECTQKKKRVVIVEEALHGKVVGGRVLDVSPTTARGDTITYVDTKAKNLMVRRLIMERPILIVGRSTSDVDAGFYDITGRELDVKEVIEARRTELDFFKDRKVYNKVSIACKVLARNGTRTYFRAMGRHKQRRFAQACISIEVGSQRDGHKGPQKSLCGHSTA